MAIRNNIRPLWSRGEIVAPPQPHNKMSPWRVLSFLGLMVHWIKYLREGMGGLQRSFGIAQSEHCLTRYGMDMDIDTDIDIGSTDF